MKIIPARYRARHRQRAWALLTVMSLSAAGLMVLAGVMNWADQNSARTARNNELFTTTYAAEAATEKALSRMSQDFQNYGSAVVNNNLTSYSQSYPSCAGAAEGTNFSQYQFSGTPGSVNQIIITNTALSNTVVMSAPYAGLTLEASTYEIIATAVNTASMYNIPATVGQQIYLGYIPLFQFAIFYQNTLEIEPNTAMTVSGTVHCNSNIYMAPSEGLTFSNAVSASGQIIIANGSTVTFDSFDLSGVDPLDLPIGTNTTGTTTNSSQDAYAILALPTPSQTPSSATGQNLLYNKADMIIIINNDNTVSVTSGAGVNGQATAITNWQAFMSTNGTFEDQRDDLTVNPVTINVSNLVNWSATNQTLRPVLASLRGSDEADVQSIYVDDLRNFTNQVPASTNVGVITNIVVTGVTTITNFTTNTTLTTVKATNAAPPLPPYYSPVPLAPPTYVVITTNSGKTIITYNYYLVNESTSRLTNYATNYTTNWVTNYASELTGQPGVVLTNGAVLPPQGLAIASPDPAYIIGNWNVRSSTNFGAPSDAGTNMTADSLPSAIYADAITVLSPAWNPANSTQNITQRAASSDTVNAAFLTGNVPTSGGEYSGGVENLPRFLENWSGQNFTYNGSMVCMFSSKIAAAPYPGTGTVFSPPTRNWAFDTNFTNPNKQPPMMPRVIMIQRNQWVSLPPNTTSF